MRELEKIKQERAAEKAKQVHISFGPSMPSLLISFVKESERSASDALARDFEVATANPLLNLQAALGQAPAPAGGFAVKRRWDDGAFLAYNLLLLCLLLMSPLMTSCFVRPYLQEPGDE